MDKCSVIITARIHSSRIPNKAIQKICGKTILERIIDRLRMASSVDDIILATTTNPEEQELVDICAKNGIKIHRGSTENVLGRFMGAMQCANTDKIMRITCDLPFLSYEGVDILTYALTKEYDYVNNCDVPDPWLDGTSTEIMWRDTVYRLNRLTPETMRQHVSIYARYGDFKTKSIPSLVDISDFGYLNVLIDEPYQLKAARFIQEWINKSGDNSYEGLCLFIMEHKIELERIWCEN